MLNPLLVKNVVEPILIIVTIDVVVVGLVDYVKMLVLFLIISVWRNVNEIFIAYLRFIVL
jgi:hypothetical protein